MKFYTGKTKIAQSLILGSAIRHKEVKPGNWTKLVEFFINDLRTRGRRGKVIKVKGGCVDMCYVSCRKQTKYGRLCEFFVSFVDWLVN